MYQAKLLIDSHCELGEGAWFDAETRTLWWLDIFGREIHKLNADTGDDRVFPTPKPVTAIVPAKNGGYALGMSDGFYYLASDMTTLRPLPMPKEVDFSTHRCNDGKCDPQGRFWIGVMELNGAKGQGALYIVDENTCTLAWDGI